MNWETGHREAFRDAALDDVGIALLPDFTAQAAIQSGKPVVLLPDWRPTGTFAEQLYVVRPYTPHVPRAVELSVTYLRETLAEGFPPLRPARQVFTKTQ